MPRVRITEAARRADQQIREEGVDRRWLAHEQAHLVGDALDVPEAQSAIEGVSSNRNDAAGTEVS